NEPRQLEPVLQLPALVAPCIPRRPRLGRRPSASTATVPPPGGPSADRPLVGLLPPAQSGPASRLEGQSGPVATAALRGAALPGRVGLRLEVAVVPAAPLVAPASPLAAAADVAVRAHDPARPVRAPPTDHRGRGGGGGPWKERRKSQG